MMKDKIPPATSGWAAPPSRDGSLFTEQQCLLSQEATMSAQEATMSALSRSNNVCSLKKQQCLLCEHLTG